MMDEELFPWVPVYEAIATALLDYENRRPELAAIANEALGEGSDLHDMDPLTFFSLFNGKLQKFERRTEAITLILKRLGIDMDAPKAFWGIPVRIPLRWRYWDGKPNSIENNWKFFRCALNYTGSPAPETRNQFVDLYNTVRAQGNVGDAGITMALYWIRPSSFLPLDSNTCLYLKNRYNITPKLPTDGNLYLALLDTVKKQANDSFTNISHFAWQESGWIPAPAEYDPGITTEQWRELLSDPSIGTTNTLIALKCLNEITKGATCTELAEFFGREKNFYSGNVSALGKRVVERLNLDTRGEKDGSYWPISCLGSSVSPRRHGSFAWKLREEVRNALNSMDLDNIPLHEDEESGHAPSFDVNRFERLIHLYKKDFARFRGPDTERGIDQESYKWGDLLAYRNNWDIDAEDFSTNAANALKPAATGEGALLGSGFEYTLSNLEKLIELDQDAVRAAFRRLYDPTANLPQAYTGFVHDMDELRERYNEFANKPMKDHHQNPKAVSLYLFFEKPNRYHYYKPTVAESLCSCINAKLPTDFVERFYSYEKLCDALMPYIERDQELLELSASRLTEEQQEADSAHHLLLQDIAYYSDAYMKDMNSDWKKIIEEGHLPMPHITYPKNLILYGPPGTGKTYQTKAYAVAICDNKSVEDVLAQMGTPEGYETVSARYRQLVENEKRIAFTTFHQSFGYEEFIEGLRPRYDEENHVMTYPVQDGVFRKFCTEAENVVETAAASGWFPRFPQNPHPRIWKMGLTTSGITDLIDLCRNDGCIRLGWDSVPPEAVDESDELSTMNKRAILAFQDEMQPGDFVIITGISSTEYGVAVITGDFEWKPELPGAKRYRSVKWLSNVDKATFIEMNGGKQLTLQAIYELSRVSAEQLIETMNLVSEPERKKQENKNYVFIIDEINRGNVSKIFGELITLLEESKRKGAREEILVTLPYSNKAFGVPSNVYIIGTMNTADRSIALMDTALRRRFTFIEVMPDDKVLNDVGVGGIDISKMLRVMNRRIELLYDREHTLGHAYLLPLREDPSIACLQSIFQNKLIPLLQEYFFDDYAKIRSVLGAAADDFVELQDATDTFWSEETEFPEDRYSYRIRRAPIEAAAYKKIYEP